MQGLELPDVEGSPASKSSTKVDFWLPSLTSSSTSNSDDRKQRKNQTSRSLDPAEVAPWLDAVKAAAGRGSHKSVNHTWGTFRVLLEPGTSGQTSSAPTSLSRSPTATATAETACSSQDASLSKLGVSEMVVQAYRETRQTVSIEKLQELEQEGLLAQIPRDHEGADGALTSIGAIRHPAGTCVPCAYWFKGICKYSVTCTYCHFIHEGQKNKRLRPSKQTRMRMRRSQAGQHQDVESSGGELSGNEGSDRRHRPLITPEGSPSTDARVPEHSSRKWIVHL